jgi:hypothetical protein
MSKYKGLFTFDEDNHRYVPIAQADGIIDCMDYDTSEPAEPLIKDEKIRKAVRAWAEACSFARIYFDEYHNAFRNINDVGFTTISFLRDVDEDILPLEDGEVYTIAELCGEEEE